MRIYSHFLAITVLGAAAEAVEAGCVFAAPVCGRGPACPGACPHALHPEDAEYIFYSTSTLRILGSN